MSLHDNRATVQHLVVFQQKLRSETVSSAEDDITACCRYLPFTGLPAPARPTSDSTDPCSLQNTAGKMKPAVIYRAAAVIVSFSAVLRGHAEVSTP